MINRKNLMGVLLVYALFGLLAFAALPAKAERFYDERGKYQGRVQDNGRIYDERGKYQGRIERDRVYDDTGKYRGRLRSGVVTDEKDQWTGATVRNESYYRMHKGHYPDGYEED